MDTKRVIPLVVVVGPTASGKSALAMDLAREYGGEIICADSRTVYKGMDIGTAKPTPEEQHEVPHHLLNIVEPGEQFSAARFKQMAEAAIQDVRHRGKLPLLVGGTGLYINAVIFNYIFGPVPEPAMREELTQKSVSELQDICVKNNIDMPVNDHNKRHLIRAIEMNGLLQQKKNLIADTFVVGIAVDREVLRKKIEKRADDMLSKGVLGESSKLAARFGWESEAMKGNIYRIARNVIEQQVSLKTAKEDVVKGDMRLAKRQMTWFKANRYIHWGGEAVLKSEIKVFLRKYNMQPVS